MINLLKYEIKKRWQSMGIALVIFAIIEIIVLFLLITDKSNLMNEMSSFKTGTAFFIITMAGGIGAVYLLVENIFVYSKDVNQTAGYMLFLTPNNGYKILGAKTIMAFLQNFIAVVIYLLAFMLNVSIIASKSMAMWNNVTIDFSLMELFNEQGQLIIFIVLVSLMAIINWVNFILTIYLSISIRKSYLSNLKHGGIISFLIFLGLTYIVTRITSILVGAVTTFEQVALSTDVLNQLSIMNGEFVKSILVVLIVGAGLFTLTGYLLDRKVSL